MKSALLVIAQQVFRDEEYAQPKAVLEAAGIDVVTASQQPGPAVGKLGLVATADISVVDAVERHWDAVAFIGGAGAAVFFDDCDAHRIARENYLAGHVVGAICIAPSVLAHAGLLEGVTATAFSSQREDLLAHGAHWSDAPVVVAGRIVTANGPSAAQEFGHRLVELLEGPRA